MQNSTGFIHYNKEQINLTIGLETILIGRNNMNVALFGDVLRYTIYLQKLIKPVERSFINSVKLSEKP